MLSTQLLPVKGGLARGAGDGGGGWWRIKRRRVFGHLLQCYDPPQFFSSSSDPLLVTLSTPKKPLPPNPPSLPDLPPLLPSEPSKPSTPIDQPPVEPLVPIPWNIHHREYSSMEEYQEPTPVAKPTGRPRQSYGERTTLRATTSHSL